MSSKDLARHQANDCQELLHLLRKLDQITPGPHHPNIEEALHQVELLIQELTTDTDVSLASPPSSMITPEESSPIDHNIQHFANIVSSFNGFTDKLLARLDLLPDDDSSQIGEPIQNIVLLREEVIPKPEIETARQELEDIRYSDMLVRAELAKSKNLIAIYGESQRNAHEFLQNQVPSLMKQVSSLTESKRQLEGENEHLESKNNQLEGKNKHLESKVSALEGQKSELEAKVKEWEEEEANILNRPVPGSCAVQ
jgi:hypothetical protein